MIEKLEYIFFFSSSLEGDVNHAHQEMRINPETQSLHLWKVLQTYGLRDNYSSLVRYSQKLKIRNRIQEKIKQTAKEIGKETKKKKI